jgi:hypothetical protein
MDQLLIDAGHYHGLNSFLEDANELFQEHLKSKGRTSDETIDLEDLKVHLSKDGAAAGEFKVVYRNQAEDFYVEGEVDAYSRYIATYSGHDRNYLFDQRPLGRRRSFIQTPSHDSCTMAREIIGPNVFKDPCEDWTLKDRLAVDVPLTAILGAVFLGCADITSTFFSLKIPSALVFHSTGPAVNTRFVFPIARAIGRAATSAAAGKALAVGASALGGFVLGVGAQKLQEKLLGESLSDRLFNKIFTSTWGSAETVPSEFIDSFDTYFGWLP